MKNDSNRRGTTMLECVVAAGILVVAISTVTSLAFRVGRIWMDVARQRIAMNELSNQLEIITLLSVEEVPEAIDSLNPSPAATSSLVEPELSGELIQDELGDRIRLQLTWKASGPVHPVELTGWLISQNEVPR